MSSRCGTVAVHSRSVVAPVSSAYKDFVGPIMNLPPPSPPFTNTQPSHLAEQDVVALRLTDFPTSPHLTKINMKLATKGSLVLEASHAPAYTELRFERRASDSMTTGEVDKGAAGHPDSPVTSGGSGHTSSHISSSIPAIFVVLVIVLGTLLGWYMVRRLRLSGRRILSFWIGVDEKPELSEVFLTETTLRHTTWSSLLPISVDFGSSEERHRWELGQTPSSHGPTPSTSKRSGMRSSTKRGRSTVFKKDDESYSEHGGLRVAVFIAMPAQRVEGVLHWQADRKIMAVQSTELCLGTTQMLSI
ncbi:hypothetical protein K466DRAFT_606047 [Polyporus arcularius HHB13444]|uniref:Uncharacterized protein n=1 Tax=Polyporus arcularius HHB13444 TaxID=1314778 RepID=A0A5C3NUA9_9APHY|nr:hypothetical protein K466DRAFT_606047 [Polyporus arcularius HHB13444]